MKATEKNLLTFHYDNADLEVWPVNIIKYTWMAVLLQREHNSQHDTADYMYTKNYRLKRNENSAIFLSYVCNAKRT